MTVRLICNAVSLGSLLVLIAFQAEAAEPTGPAANALSVQEDGPVANGLCAQLRAQIAAQTTILARPNIELLGKVGANEQCRFTSAEVYRAAWGAKPFKLPEARGAAHDQED